MYKSSNYPHPPAYVYCVLYAGIYSYLSNHFSVIHLFIVILIHSCGALSSFFSFQLKKLSVSISVTNSLLKSFTNNRAESSVSRMKNLHGSAIQIHESYGLFFN